MKPLPDGSFTVCDYKTVTRIPDNYHIEYDSHYYSVVYTHCGKSAIVKATASEIRICDQYNRLICKHKRSYRDFPKLSFGKLNDAPFFRLNETFLGIDSRYSAKYLQGFPHTV